MGLDDRLETFMKKLMLKEGIDVEFNRYSDNGRAELEELTGQDLAGCRPDRSWRYKADPEVHGDLQMFGGLHMPGSEAILAAGAPYMFDGACGDKQTYLRADGFWFSESADGMDDDVFVTSTWSEYIELGMSRYFHGYWQEPDARLPDGSTAEQAIERFAAVPWVKNVHATVESVQALEPEQVLPFIVSRDTSTVRSLAKNLKCEADPDTVVARIRTYKALTPKKTALTLGMTIDQERTAKTLKQHLVNLEKEPFAVVRISGTGKGTYAHQRLLSLLSQAPGADELAAVLTDAHMFGRARPGLSEPIREVSWDWESGAFECEVLVPVRLLPSDLVGASWHATAQLM